MKYSNDTYRRFYSAINNPVELLTWYIPIYGSMYLKLLYENEFDYKDQLVKEVNENVFDNRFQITHKELNQLELITKPHLELLQFYTRLAATFKPLKLKLYKENEQLYSKYGFELFDYIIYDETINQIPLIGTEEEKKQLAKMKQMV